MKQPIDVLHVDDDILVISKDAGIGSTPDRYDPNVPHVRGLLEPSHGRLFLVHRLDRSTSGVMILAKNEDAHAAMCASFENRPVKTVYHAICVGAPVWEDERVEYPLRAGVGRRARTVVDHHRGKPSATQLRVLEKWRGYSLVEALPERVRIHQIRVHLMTAGIPLASDDLYGGGGPVFLSQLKRNYRPGRREERPLIDRPALHALSIAFTHPAGAEVVYEAPYARDFRACANQLRKLYNRHLSINRSAE